MQVEQKNIWENVTQNVKRNNNDKAIAAYQANMPDTSNIFGMQREHFDKTAGVSDKGTIEMATYQNPATEQKETVAEQFEQKDSFNEKNRKNEMIVVSNTTSTEDCKKLMEDGFSLSDTSSRVIVTVTDKIKTVLAKAGVDISRLGDGLSKEKLEQITGSTQVADQIMQVLKENDLPSTDENVGDCLDALKQVAAMPEISENTMAYMIQNQLAPSIHNLYIAQYSSIPDGSNNKMSQTDIEELADQIEQIIIDAALPVDETSKANSKWLIENNIPLTKENLRYLSDLQEISGQLENDTVDWTQLLHNMADAISQKKRPEDASMITAKRKLEETRLAMTSEASTAMMKKGIEIDTQPLEELVDYLKEQEKEYYKDLLTYAGVDPTKENVDIMEQTINIFDELKNQPAYVLGKIEADDTVLQIHEQGLQLQTQFAKASESYETLMTVPRTDMGDSIRKAFSNVDDILTDLKLDISPVNQRAVRILAYNQLTITEESIKTVKAMDEQMQRAFHNLNPSVTIEMIRKGENPLDMNMEQLNEAIEEIRQVNGNDEEERFSKYLWKLEQNHEITEEERSSYIGIYRLIAQVEKTDGAALGYLLDQGSEVTMRNLLTAVRSRRKGTVDYEIDDDFNGVNAKAKTPRIDAQIEIGFQQNCLRDVMDRLTPDRISRIGRENWENMTPEQFAQKLAEMPESVQETEAAESYIQEQLALYQKVFEAPEEVYTYLERYDITNSMTNIMAANDLLRKPNQIMEKLWKQGNVSKSSLEKIKDLKDQVLERFGESLKNPEELADAQEALADVAEHVMDTMLIEDPDVRTLDIREMHQLKKQFTLCAEKAQEESYLIPIQTGNSVTGVSLKVVRGKKKKGFVDILFDHSSIGKVAASFQTKENGISGMIAVHDEETRQLLEDHLDELKQKLQNYQDGTQEAVDIKIAHVEDLSLSHYEIAGLVQEQKMKENGELAEDRTDSVQTGRLYHIAENFIQSIQSL